MKQKFLVLTIALIITVSMSACELTDLTSSSAQEVAGVSSDFKAVMDSYEEFIDEYITFMNSYDPSDLTALSRYADYMTKYSETMSNLAELENDDLTAAELAYYTEVMLRINQKLASVVG